MILKSHNGTGCNGTWSSFNLLTSTLFWYNKMHAEGKVWPFQIYKLRGWVLRQLACTVGVELPSLTISTLQRSDRYPQWCLYIKATIALAKWRNVEWQQPRGIDNVIFCLKSYLFLGNLILLLVHGCVVGHRGIAPFLCLCSLQETDHFYLRKVFYK